MITVHRFNLLVTSRNVPTKRDFGYGTGVVWMHNVSCTGNERHVLECDYSINNQQHCVGGSVGVACSDAAAGKILV
jgi:hypothetical protein